MPRPKSPIVWVPWILLLAAGVGLAQSGTTTRIEQNDPSISYAGSWSANSNAGDSGGSAAGSNTRAARATLTFFGTGITWLGVIDVFNGFATVTLDGIVYTADTYATFTDYQVPLFTVTGLARGTHVLTIDVTGNRHPDAQASWVWIDGFDIQNEAGASAQQYFLPQVANGAFAGGSFRNTFVVSNNSDQPAAVSIALTDDNGAPLAVTVPGMGRNSQFSLTLPAGTTRFLQTDGSGPLVTGAAAVTSSAPIAVSAIFAVYDPAGNFLTEAGVGSSAPATSFVLPVDTTGNSNTGMALFNSGPGTAGINLSLVQASGQQVSSANLTLTAGTHLVNFIAGPGQLFPGAVNFRGLLVVTSTTAISAVTLRQNSSPLSYTSLPVVPRTGGKTRIYLPQIANGSFEGGIFRTTFPIFNLSDSPANVVVTLLADDGSPLVVTIPGLARASVFTLQIPAGGSFFLETDGNGSLAAGSAGITSDVPIAASAIFTVSDPQGRFLTEAGVGDSARLTELTVPVDIRNGSDTGVALFNPLGNSIGTTLRLRDESGVVVGTRHLTIRLNSHVARFVSEFFPGYANFRGSLSIVAVSGIAAVTLRQNTLPLAYTTLPVTTGMTHTVTPAP